jgi:hypothetical protein
VSAAGRRTTVTLEAALLGAPNIVAGRAVLAAARAA